MIQAGDVHLADLRDEQRWVVLVVSNDRFHRASDRVLVAPGVDIDHDEVVPPWLVRVEDQAFALHLMRSIPSSRLLERVGRASSVDVQRARRAIRQIT